MSGSIKDRMAAQLKFNEKQIWNAFLHAGQDLLPYLSKNVFGDTDCVFILADGTPLVGKKINEFFESVYGKSGGGAAQKWSGYEMNDEEVIEVDMMAGIIYYGIVASKVENNQLTHHKLACSSVWRQNADGEYTLCSHQQTKLP